jgi:hypothetical protein
MKLYVEVPYVKLRALIGDDISKHVRSYDYIEPFRIFNKPYIHGIDEVKVRSNAWMVCRNCVE